MGTPNVLEPPVPARCHHLGWLFLRVSFTRVATRVELWRLLRVGDPDGTPPRLLISTKRLILVNPLIVRRVVPDTIRFSPANTHASSPPRLSPEAEARRHAATFSGRVQQIEMHRT